MIGAGGLELPPCGVHRIERSTRTRRAILVQHTPSLALCYRELVSLHRQFALEDAHSLPVAVRVALSQGHRFSIAHVGCKFATALGIIQTAPLLPQFVFRGG